MVLVGGGGGGGGGGAELVQNALRVTDMDAQWPEADIVQICAPAVSTERCGTALVPTRTSVVFAAVPNADLMHTELEQLD